MNSEGQGGKPLQEMINTLVAVRDDKHNSRCSCECGVMSRYNCLTSSDYLWAGGVQ